MLRSVERHVGIGHLTKVDATVTVDNDEHANLQYQARVVDGVHDFGAPRSLR